jgi:hypothetical protein
LAATVGRLARRGHSVVVLSTSGETWPEQLAGRSGGVDVRDVSFVDTAWRAPSSTEIEEATP